MMVDVVMSQCDRLNKNDLDILYQMTRITSAQWCPSRACSKIAARKRANVWELLG